MNEKEIRTIAGELRRGDDEQRLVGYAAMTNAETVIGSGPHAFRERIAPGAFTDAIGRDDVRALFNHDPNYVLGRTKAGTLRLEEDARGLRYDVTPPETAWAKDLMTSVSRGDITQSSFGFIVEDQDWEQPAQRGELPLRTIRKVSLFDVSPVTYPAYEQTSVSARDQAKACAEPVAMPAPRSYAGWLAWIDKAAELFGK
jgi:HK97 family phage prohead protease